MIVITRQTEPDAPQRFGPEQPRIVLGRHPDHCQVVFPADATAVGKEHCAFIRERGRYVLEVDSRYRVAIDGELMADGTELPDRAEIQLGPDGPLVLIEITPDEGLPPTVDQEGVAGVQTIVAATGRSASRARLVGRLALVLVVLVGIAIAVVVSQQQAQQQQLDQHRREAAQLQVLVDANAEKVSKTDHLADVLLASADAVFVVIGRNHDHEEWEPMGTAWVAAKGILATNAHVADGLVEYSQRAVRGHRAGHPTFLVNEITNHPGYETFEKLWQKHLPGAGTTPTSSAGGCDVALLRCADPDGLGEPLPLASAEELAALQPGDAVGFVGFPMEGLALDGVNVKRPSAQTKMGNITAITDYFGGRLTAGSTHDAGALLQHNLLLTGGASGSPLIHHSGKVVGLVNAANFFFLNISSKRTVRIPSAVGVNFAQRVDVLQDLLQGRADQRMAVYEQSWLATMQQDFGSRQQRMHNRYLSEWLQVIEDNIGSVGKPVTLREASLQTATKEGNAMLTWIDLGKLKPGFYLILATTDGEADIDMLSLVSGKRLLDRDEAPNNYPVNRFGLEREEAVRIAVFNPHEDGKQSFTYRVLYLPLPKS